MLQEYLFFSVTGFLVSLGIMLAAGQRCDAGRPLEALLYFVVLLYGCHQLSGLLFGQTIRAEGVLLTLVLGLPVIALARNWNLLGQVNYALTVQAVLAFVSYVISMAWAANPDPLEGAISLFLLLLVICSMLLMLVQAFEIIDVICRRRWRRVAQPQPPGSYLPKVSLHVPAHNEPPEMVIATLDALAALDYPDYEVLLIDNNTSDESLWRPVQAHCEKLGFRFFHLENWPGYKSGALNFAITETAADAEIIGIIDADYIVESTYLRDLVGYFSNEQLAFVQTPQDYRDFDLRDRYQLACYHAYQYFFKLSMASRNERNGIIFAGTMGLIRKRVLDQVGGWDEWCITEDAEISVKILDLGYESLFIDRTYGRGMMPLDFEGLKKQRFRWAFGGMQVLRLHWRKLLPRLAPGKSARRLSWGQKFDFWSGGLQWLNDPITFLFTLLLMMNAASLSITATPLFETLLGAGLYVPFLFILFGLARTLWALRLRLGCTTGQAFRAMLVLFSLTWVVTLACVFGLTRKGGVFLRTPKQADETGITGALHIVRKEVLLALGCGLCILWLLSADQLTASAWLLSGLLSWQMFIYGSALAVSRWSVDSQTSAAVQLNVTAPVTTG